MSTIEGGTRPLRPSQESRNPGAIPSPKPIDASTGEAKASPAAQSSPQDSAFRSDAGAAPPQASGANTPSLVGQAAFQRARRGATPQPEPQAGLRAGLESVAPEQSLTRRPNNESGLRCVSIPPFTGEALEQLDKDYGWAFQDLNSSHASQQTKYRQFVTDLTVQTQD